MRPSAQVSSAGARVGGAAARDCWVLGAGWLGRYGALERAEQPLPQAVVDRAAVVGVDQAQVPQLVALVGVGDAGDGQLEQRLAEAVDRADARRDPLEPRECRSGTGVLRFGSRIAATNCWIAVSYPSFGLIQLVWTFASLVAFAMYSWIRAGELGAARPRPDSSSGQAPSSTWYSRYSSLRDGAGSPSTSVLVAAVQARPAGQGGAPLARHLGEHRDPRSDVLAALGVVGGGGEQAVRPALQALGVQAVERRHRDAERLRLAADLVERDQPVVDVERRVLHGLGRDRAGRLLDLLHELELKLLALPGLRGPSPPAAGRRG